MLDFPAVRTAVASQVRYGPVRQKAALIAPSFDAAEVAALRAETEQGRRLLSEAGDIDLTLEVDPAPGVARAALGGVLAGSDLILVAGAVRVFERAAALARFGSVAPDLAAMAGRLPDLSDLAGAIEGAVSERGEVLDTASPGLRSLRARVRGASEGVTSALSGMIDSDIRTALQDRVISLRSERLCLQVRADMRQRVPGIVHDASKSGSTLYVEPMATIELGNLWRELVLEERREVARILAGLSARVGDAATEYARASDLTGCIDLALARARYGALTGGVTPPSAGRGGPRNRPAVNLVDARHPLLGGDAVPICIQLGPLCDAESDWSVLVITGPNTGGKTVAIKTLGLLAVMNQAGIQVPVGEGSVLPLFDSFHVDLGDRQSIERSVSTFSSHMGRVIDILGGAGPGSLVLLDELGSSTDPEEGAALARAVLDHLAERRILSVATTHHRSVAAHAQTTEGMESASVDLDPDTLAPTYSLTIREAGRSYAMAVAARLGMPRSVLGAAESYLDPASARYDESARQMRRAMAAAEAARKRSEASAASARRAQEELDAERAGMIARKDDIAEEMQAELAIRHGELTRRLARAEAALSWDIGGSGSSAGIRPLVAEARNDLAEAGSLLREIRAAANEGGGTDQPSVSEGDVVEVRGIGATGVVQNVQSDTGQAEVAMGGVRLMIHASRLVSTGQKQDMEQPVVAAVLGPALESGELDLRGMRAGGAAEEVERFLDMAARDGMSSVRIVHGRATGALRRAVRERLDGHPLVRGFGGEEPERGGEGATRVDLF